VDLIAPDRAAESAIREEARGSQMRGCASGNLWPSLNSTTSQPPTGANGALQVRCGRGVRARTRRATGESIGVAVMIQHGNGLASNGAGGCVLIAAASESSSTAFSFPPNGAPGSPVVVTPGTEASKSAVTGWKPSPASVGECAATLTIPGDARRDTHDRCRFVNTCCGRKVVRNFPRFRPSHPPMPLTAGRGCSLAP
jgi:hypothetical protein